MSAPRGLRILQLVSRDDIGGVRALTRMIGGGLTEAGAEVETLALIGEGGLAARLSHLAHVCRRVVGGGHDAIIAYHTAASVLMGALGCVSLGAVARAPVRMSHLTALPGAIRRRWRWADMLLGSMGGYTHIIANSVATEAAFSTYPRGFRRRMHLIAHGVAPLPAPVEPDPWRRRLGVPDDAPLLVASGRLTAQKDFATAIRALAGIPRAHLAIAGEGSDESALKILAEEVGVADRLDLVGALSRERLGGFLAAGEAYLFPSVWESFGLAGVEALMLGLPVVASDLPVLREVLVSPGAPATVVRFAPPRDARALAAATRAVLAAPPSQAERQAAAAAARQRHAVAVMIDRYRALLPSANGAVL